MTDICPMLADLEMEKSILASMILFPDSIIDAVGVVKGSDFYHRQHGALFDKLLSMADQSIPIDAISAAASVEHGPEMVGAVIDTPLSADIRWVASQVREKSVRRGLMAAAAKIQSMCTERVEFSELLSFAQKNFMEAEDQSGETWWMTADDIAGDIIQDVSGDTPISRIKSPFVMLNYKIGGFLPGDLVVIAGRPGMGKSAMMINLAMEFSNLGQKSGIFSLEMSGIQIVQRILSICGRINLNEFKIRIKNDLMSRLTAAGEKIARAGILINDKGGLKHTEICRIARRMQRKEGIAAIFVDYIQLVTGSRGQSRNDEIAEVSRAFKSLAKELQITVFALSQLNRGVESREDKRPKLSDLRESGQIEQDADIVLFPYREAVYSKTANPRVGEIIIAKQRQGETGDVPVAWNAEFTEYANLEVNHASY